MDHDISLVVKPPTRLLFVVFFPLFDVLSGPCSRSDSNGNNQIYRSLSCSVWFILRKLPSIEQKNEQKKKCNCCIDCNSCDFCTYTENEKIVYATRKCIATSKYVEISPSSDALSVSFFLFVSHCIEVISNWGKKMIDFNEQFLFVLKEEEKTKCLCWMPPPLLALKKACRKSIIIEKNISICCTNQIH